MPAVTVIPTHYRDRDNYKAEDRIVPPKRSQMHSAVR